MYFKPARVYFAKIKAQQDTLAKKYSWAIAQAVWRPCYVLSSSRACVRVWISNGIPCVYTQFQLAQNL